MLGHKEDKVLDLQEQVVRLREELALANMDWEKASVSRASDVTVFYS